MNKRARAEKLGLPSRQKAGWLSGQAAPAATSAAESTG